MKFSLILCTLDRTEEVENFLLSLVNQTYKNFEVVIVDQNDDNRLQQTINHFQNSLNILYQTSALGLSLGRNKGLSVCTGDIVCFPDDDCMYPSELLENIKVFFLTHDYDILIGKTIDINTGKIVAGKNVSLSQVLYPNHILGSSTTLFIRSKNIKIKFDERFGLGAIFNAEEENDLLFRLLKRGYKGYYAPDINYVYHPPSDLDFTNLERIYNRSIGLGAFIAKHLFSKEGLLYFIKYNIFRPLLGSFLYLLKLDMMKSKFYFFKFLGIWKGFIQYFRFKNETDIC